MKSPLTLTSSSLVLVREGLKRRDLDGGSDFAQANLALKKLWIAFEKRWMEGDIGWRTRHVVVGEVSQGRGYVTAPV